MRQGPRKGSEGMDYMRYGDIVLALVSLFFGCQVIYWLVLQAVVLWLAVAATRALEQYRKGR